MDVRGYKTAPPLAVRLDGELIWLDVLPRLPLQQAEDTAAALFRAHGCDPSGPWFEATRRAHVLAAAIGCTAEEFMATRSGVSLSRLWARWNAHQERFSRVANLGALREELRKRSNDDVEVILDGESAYLSGPEHQDPSTYYGRPTTLLTDAQVDYYTLVRAAFMEFHLGEKRKEVSAQWLSSPSV